MRIRMHCVPVAPFLSTLMLLANMLVEHTTNDAYWGDGGQPNWQPGVDGNRLGMILMEVRPAFLFVASIF
jgi:predicted NAD-dependent protein-ADP-ribosyltransferase YbiA (DUF1768 family)